MLKSWSFGSIVLINVLYISVFLSLSMLCVIVGKDSLLWRVLSQRPQANNVSSQHFKTLIINTLKALHDLRVIVGKSSYVFVSTRLKEKLLAFQSYSKNWDSHSRRFLTAMINSISVNKYAHVKVKMVYCWFSRDVTKIQTTKRSILARFLLSRCIRAAEN